MKNRNKKGFTIIELVIVIAVIGILTAVLVPVFINLTAKANEAADDSLVKNLNTALKMEEALLDNPKNETLQDAIDDLEAEGYILENLVSKSGKDLLWSQSENQFYLNKEDKYSGKDYWQIVNEVPAYENQKYSYYAGKNFKTDVPNLKYGFDSGKVENITSLKYVGNGVPGQTVNIRTNSASTTLTIDDASTGTIYHYGAAGALNIIQCHTASYHENGKVAYAEIAKGRIVLEAGSKIEEIHVNKKENEQAFDTVIIANNGGAEELPERITRDAVTVSEETLVVKVESNGSSENVYVYADVETGTKGSTQQITEGVNKQNENVNSALGQLVLDNGSTSDKAQTAQEKAEAKEEIVETAKNNEEIEKAEDAGYEITHHDALAPTCTEDGHTAYDSYYINNEEHKVGYKVIEALGHDVDPETGICNRCSAQVYVFKVGTSLYKSNQFSAAWSAAKNSSNSFKILCDLTLNAIQADGRFTLDLNGKTLTLRGHASLSGAVRVYGLTDHGGDLTIQNGTLELPGTNNINYGIYSEGNLTVENVTINSACKTTVYVDGLAWNSVGSANLTNVVINATHASGTAYNAHSVSMYGTIYSPVSNLTNVTITSANDAVTINATNANLHSCNITASGRAAWIIFSATGNTIGTMTIDGETTLNAGSAYNRLNAQDGNTIVIEAGTYNFDPTNYVNTEAFDIAENAGVYTVSSK